MITFRHRSSTTVLVLLVAITLVLAACTTPANPAASGTVAKQPDKPFASPTSSGLNFVFGVSRNLVGASTEQIASFAQQYAKVQPGADGSEPRVLLVRFVKNEELNGLGIQCLNFSAIEEPPLALVVLKGNFGTTKPAADGSIDHSSYEVLIFDLWAAEAAYGAGSLNGGSLRQVLNDPNLPEDYPGQSDALAAQQPAACQKGRAAKTLHYGETAAGSLSPVAGQPTITRDPALPTATRVPRPNQAPLPPAISTSSSR